LTGRDFIVTPSGRACIADFGLSSIITAMSSMQLTDSAQRARGGTLRYQAPELFKEGHNTPDSDVYAFACVAYQLLTGNHPFWEVRQTVVISKVIDGFRPSKPTVCSAAPELDGLWHLLQECWEEQPTVRPSATELVDRL
ncbi:kinase-like domain-containing protein, partial [Mycena leptocephala]